MQLKSSSTTRLMAMLLSLVLCFCLFSKQAEQVFGADYDVPDIMLDMNSFEPDTNDAGEPALPPSLQFSLPPNVFLALPTPVNFYRQPAFSPGHPPPRH